MTRQQQTDTTIKLMYAIINFALMHNLKQDERIEACLLQILRDFPVYGPLTTIGDLAVKLMSLGVPFYSDMCGEQYRISHFDMSPYDDNAFLDDDNLAPYKVEP